MKPHYANLLRNELVNPQQAEHHYQRAIEINPELGQAYNNYGLLLETELDNIRQAEHHYQHAIKINPEDAEAHYNYANLLSNELDKPEEAQHHYERTIEIDPDYAEAYTKYATLLLDLTHFEQAREHLETSVHLFIDQGILTNALSCLRALVLLCRNLRDDEAVVEHCERALSLLNERDDSQGDDWLWFRSQQALVDDVETLTLYNLALRNVRATEPSMAVELFEETWNRRTEYPEDSGEQTNALASGVALAAYAEIPEAFEIPPAAEILDELDPDTLHHPEIVVYEQLIGSDPDTDGKELFESAQQHREEDNELAALEAEVFGILLGQLQ